MVLELAGYASDFEQEILCISGRSGKWADLFKGPIHRLPSFKETGLSAFISALRAFLK